MKADEVVRLDDHSAHLSFNSTVAPHLEGCAQLGAPHYKKDFDILGEYSDGHQDDQMTEACDMR
ncbi:hypothetical protein QYF61_019486 [Mycteria americana]|uniref:Uncharacterized protein n=1 Tax=Mycteria americana TaxID=33587 RepID=A0AAN7S0A6_MYCAM|nr:hypothetical protein QYF61_019486 [Mycteria americana]